MDKKAILPPLFSAFISYVFLAFYLFFHSFDTNNIWHYLYNYLLGIFKIFPITYFGLSLISYFYYFTVGKIIIKVKNKYFLSTGFFWLLSFLTGSLIGFILAGIIYYYKHSWGQSIWIFMSFSLGATFLSSLYSVLSGEVETK